MLYEIFVFGIADLCTENLGGGWGLYLRTRDEAYAEKRFRELAEKYGEENVEFTFM